MVGMHPVGMKHFVRVTKFNAVLTAVENVVFLLLSKWDFTVLIGSLWGLLMTSAYFYLICVSVPRALNNTDANVARKHIQATYLERMLVIALGVIIAFKVSFIHSWAAVIPLLFTRISISILYYKNNGEEE